MKIIDRIKIGLGIALVAALAGCAGGYVGVDGGGYGGTVVVPVADPFFGGGFYDGGYARGYAHRGFASRGAAHGGGGVRGGGARGGGGRR
jgi:hypothetical protein